MSCAQRIAITVASWLLLSEDRSIEKSLRAKADKLTSEFFRHLGNEFTDDLYDNASDEELFEQIYPRYRQWFQDIDIDPHFFDIFYYGVLECVIDAFLYARHGHKYLHPFASFISVAYDHYCILLGRAEERRIKAIANENAELKEQFASIDENKEWHDELPPAEKTRVFKQALYSRNKVGWICLGGERKTDQIIITPNALKDMEKLFALNPDATPGDFLRIMDKCMALHSTHPPAKKYRAGIKWHARMGHKLSMFTRHLELIMRDLNITTHIRTEQNIPKPFRWRHE